jgi:hypothetical protein
MASWRWPRASDGSITWRRLHQALSVSTRQTATDAPTTQYRASLRETQVPPKGTSMALLTVSSGSLLFNRDRKF